MGGAQTPIEIKLFGKDLDVLKQTADVIVDRIKGIEGVRDVTHSLAPAKPEYHIRIDRERAAQLGLMVGQVGRPSRRRPWARWRRATGTPTKRSTSASGSRRRIGTPSPRPGTSPCSRPSTGRVYLDQVATIEKGSGPMQISRENQSRRVSITGNIAGRDLGSVVRDIKKGLGGLEKELPPGLFPRIRRGLRTDDRGLRDPFRRHGPGHLLIYMVMASQFESLLHPFIIMFTIPLGLIGVVIGLLVTGRPVNLPVMVGFIILEGVAVNNGIVMIDYINQLVRGGMDETRSHSPGMLDPPQARPADGLDDRPGDASHGHGHVFRGRDSGPRWPSPSSAVSRPRRS